MSKGTRLVSGRHRIWSQVLLAPEPWCQPSQHKHMPHKDLFVSGPVADIPAATSRAGVTTPSTRAPSTGENESRLPEHSTQMRAPQVCWLPHHLPFVGKPNRQLLCEPGGLTKQPRACFDWLTVYCSLGAWRKKPGTALTPGHLAPWVSPAFLTCWKRGPPAAAAVTTMRPGSYSPSKGPSCCATDCRASHRPLHSP